MKALSANGSLLLPLVIEGPPRFELGGVGFVAKAEHHLTVFGVGRGKLLLAAAAVDPPLRAKVERAARAFAFKVALENECLHLVEVGPEGRLETIIILATARIEAFFDEIRAIVRGEDPAEVALVESLGSPPPPHLTLFTSDPAGRRAIGIASEAELEAALAAADGSELTARPIPAESAPTVKLVPQKAQEK